jgi:imidazolonepropionase-like amidohydrolase
MDPGSTRTASDFLKLDDAAQLTLMASNSLKLLDAGVTTARDLGCPKTLAVTLRDQIACGERNGPRCDI